MLDGVHPLLGLRQAKHEIVNSGLRPLTTEADTVVATILAHNTPVHIRRAIIGDERHRLVTAVPIPCSEFLRCLARW